MGKRRSRFVASPIPEGRPTPELAARKRDRSEYRWGRFDSLDEMNEQEWEAFDVRLRLKNAQAAYGWSLDENGRKVEHGLDEMSAAFAADDKMRETLGYERYQDVVCIQDWYFAQLGSDARAAVEADHAST